MRNVLDVKYGSLSRETFEILIFHPAPFVTVAKRRMKIWKIVLETCSQFEAVAFGRVD
jgi:hypothetical protein